MALFEMINTEMQFISPLGDSIEAAFGRTALKLLEKGDQKSLEKMMKLYDQARSLVKELDKLTKTKR